MNTQALREQLIRHEGCKRSAYQDHLGYWTIGVGRLIDARRGGGLSDDEIDYLLANDIAKVVQSLAGQLPYWSHLSDRQQQALCNMAFQLGVNGLLRFRKMLAALERGDGADAHWQALDSNWAKQTPERAAEVAAMLED
jgi:lysozyme